MREPGRVADDLREAIRDARALLKDLKQATREVRELLDKSVPEQVEERIETAVVKGLGEYQGALRTAIDEATDKVTREFDRLEQLFLGTSAANRRAGEPSIEELIRRRGDGGSN